MSFLGVGGVLKSLVSEQMLQEPWSEVSADEIPESTCESSKTPPLPACMSAFECVSECVCV